MNFYAMRRTAILFLFWALGNSILAQVDGKTEQLMARKFLTDLINGENVDQLKSDLPKELSGLNPYFLDQARPTTIYTLDGDTVVGFYNYNVALEKLVSESSEAEFPWYEVISFTFNATDKEEALHFSNQKLFHPTGQMGGFVQDIKVSKDVKKKHYLVFEPGSARELPYSSNSKDQLILKTDILLRLGEYQIVEMPNSKSDFYDLFKEDAKRLKKYAKANKLKPRRIEDVGQLLNWLKNGN